MGASARLTGRIHLAGEGVTSRIAIVRGPNIGVELSSDDQGTFRSQKLLPGLTRIEIRPTNRAAFERIVVLRPHRQNELVLDLARLPDVEGWVEDESGRPLVDVEVSLDGARVHTDAYGAFRISRAASGRAPLVARATGKADARVWVGGERVGPPYAPLRLRMQPSCSLRIEPTGGESSGTTRVLVLPVVRDSGGFREAAYPWEALLTVEVGPSGRVDLDGLPAGPMRVVSIERDALGEAHVTLRPGQRALARPRAVAQPRLQGVVEVGEYDYCFRVELRAAPVKTIAIALGRDADEFYRQAIDPMPPTCATTTVDAGGRFDLPWWDSGGRPQVLSVFGAKGSRWVQTVQSRMQNLHISF